MFDAAEFRRVLGRLPTGVVVVTAADADGSPAGMTCNSFTSVSLDPPLVLFCVGNASTTWPRLRAAGRFCVNVLAEHHDTVSARFARDGDRFAEGTWLRRPSGYALADALCRLDCTIETEYDGGDHRIVLGRVTSLESGPDHPPLIFHRGGYRTAAPGTAALT